MSFENLKLIEPIRKALKAEGYTKPTPIQEKAIPVILERKDLLGCAQTGTGKTAAFALPILQVLHKTKKNKSEKRKVRSLILTPTRELAVQIGESFTAYGKFLDIHHTVIFGGVHQRTQMDDLHQGVDIIIATPGRLIDLMNQTYINFEDLEVLVLDEADRMLDMGFIHDIKMIISTLPDEKQSLFFSATMPPAIVKLSGSILNQPVKIKVAPVSSTAETINQSVYFVEHADKYDLLMHILEDEEIETALVFTRTKFGAEKLSKSLRRNGIKADAIHGDKDQLSRQDALNAFKNKDIRVLVATDVASRGIDVDDLSHVINYEIPNSPETYVHRIGRTGRAGARGTSLSFCDQSEFNYLLDINKLISKQIPAASHPFEYF